MYNGVKVCSDEAVTGICRIVTVQTAFIPGFCFTLITTFSVNESNTENILLFPNYFKIVSLF